jgi:hypothetical protein
MFKTKTISLNDNTWNLLEKQADELGLSQSALIRLLILKNEKKEAI